MVAASLKVGSQWLALPILAAACSHGSEPPACTPDTEPAVTVEVRDSVSGAPVASGARGVVQDGVYVDSLQPFGYLDDGTTLVSLSAADERPGTYAVTVERQRYKQWRLAGVVVPAGTCHVETVSLVALLQPLINPP